MVKARTWLLPQLVGTHPDSRTWMESRSRLREGMIALPEPEKTRLRQLTAASPMSLYSPFLIWNSHMPPWIPMWSSAE